MSKIPKVLFAILWALLVLDDIQLWPPEKLESEINRLELRKLSHRCWWKPSFCCQPTLKQCLICANRCNGNDWTIEKYDDNGADQCCCGMKNNCDNTNTFSCELKINVVAPPLAFTFQRNSGTAHVILENDKTMFTSTTPAKCGGYHCRAMLRQSGPDISAQLTTVVKPLVGGKTTFDANTCPLPTGAQVGTSVYKAWCGAEDADLSFKESEDISITLVDFCTSVTKHTHTKFNQFHQESGNTVTGLEAFAGNWLTIVTTPSCVFNTCVIVTAASAAACNAHTSTVAYITGSLVGTTISYTIDTTTVRANAYYCLSCESNECGKTIFQSNPFEMEVTCASSGYTVTNHASLVNKEIIYILDGVNFPFFPVGQFSYSEASCPIETIEYYDTAKTVSPPPGLGPTIKTGAAANALVNVVATNRFIGGTYPFKMKITLKGGQVHWAILNGDEEFILRVCGSETIQKQLTSDPYYKYFYQAQGTTPSYEKTETDVVPWFISTDPSCPIVTHQLETAAGVLYVGTDLKLTQVGTTWMLIISTKNPIPETTFYVRANTGSGITNLQPFQVRVCGDEVVNTVVGYLTFFKYDYNIGSQTYVTTNVHPAFSNVDPFCVINLYQISQSGTTYVVSPITQLDGTDNQLSVTTTPGIFNLWIMASTRTPISAFYPIQVLICGFEVLTGILATPPSYYFSWNTATNSIEIKANLITSWFSNTQLTHCPIVDFTLHTGPTPPYTPYTGQVFVDGVSKDLKVNTTPNNIKLTLFLRANTQAPIYAYQQFDILICGQETVSLLLTAVPEYKYYYRVGSAPLYEQRPQDVVPWFQSSDPNCVITTSVVEQETSPSVFTPYTTGDVYIAPVGSTLMLAIHTVSPMTKTLYVKACTHENKCNRQQIYVRVCGDETITLTGKYPTFFKYYIYRGNMVHTKYVVPAFYNPDPFCVIWKYRLSTSPVGYVASTTGYVDSNWFQVIQTNIAGRFDLWIMAETRTPIIAYHKIKVLICGAEVTAGIKTPTPYFYRQWNSGAHTLEFSLATWFTNTEAVDCPFVNYTIFFFNTTSGGYEEFNHFQVKAIYAATSDVFNLNLGTIPDNMKQSLFVRSETLSPVIAYQPFDVLICGKEEVRVPEGNLLIVLKKNSGTKSQMKYNYKEWLVSTWRTICPVNQWTLHEQFISVYTPYTKGIVSLNSGSQEFEISTTKSSHFYIYLKGLTIGQKFNYKRIEIEICGDEVVKFNLNGKKGLIYEYVQYSGGYDYTHQIHPRDFLQLVYATSFNCLIEVPLTKLYYRDQNTGNLNEFVSDKRVWLTLPTGYIYIRTEELYTLELFVMVKTASSPEFYIPLRVIVMEQPNFLINVPPFFHEPEGYMLNYTINARQDVYNMTWNITGQGDDHYMLDFMNFSHSEFGNLSYKYENLTMKPYYSDESYQTMMSYDINRTEFTISVKGGIDEVVQYVGPIYLIRIWLYDQQGLSTRKDLWLNVTLNYSDPEIIQKEPEIVDEIIGKIEYISVFGEVDIKLLQNRVPVPDFPLHTINETHMSIFIQPSEGWEDWREQNASSSLNLTWKVLELTKDKMRIKLNLDSPTEVSPLLRYDRLVIHFKDLRALFIDERQRRRLSPSILISTMDAGIQKQMWDTGNGRETVKAIYRMRSTLVLMFVIFFVFSFGMNGPFDRMITMLLDLQLMSYLCMLHVPMPANVVISSQVNRPFVSFHILSILGSGGEKVQELEYLGQRQTFGFQTYEAYQNMETMGVVFLIYLAKIVFTLLVCLTRLIFKKKGEKLDKLKKKLLDAIFFSDLISIFVFGMLELGSGFLLNMKNKNLNDAASRSNFTLALVGIGFGFMLLPFIYRLILRQNSKEDFAQKKFQQKFGRFMFGADLTKRQKEGNLTHVVMFWFKRYAVLVVAFYVEHTGFQVMLLLSAFMFSSAQFARTMPVYGWWGKAIGFFNQCSLVLVYIHLVAFTDFVEAEAKYASGFSLLFFVQFFIIVNFLYMNIDLLNCIILIISNLFPDFTRWYEAFMLMLKKLWNLRSHARCPKFKIPLPKFEILYALEDVIIPNAGHPETLISQIRREVQEVSVEEVKENPEVEKVPETITPRQIIKQKQSKFVFGKKSQVEEIKEEIEESDTEELPILEPEITVEEEPTAPEPPSPEPLEPVEPILQLVDGVWKRLLIRVNQDIDSKNYLGNEPPTWQKVLMLKTDTPEPVQPTIVIEQPESSEEEPLPEPVVEEVKLDPELKLVKGIWTRLFKRVNQEIDYKDRISKNFLDNEQPIWQKIIQYAKDQAELEVESDKPVSTRTKTGMSELDMLSFYDAQKMKTKKAKFHDPSLYYRDENKDRTSKLEVVEETNQETGEIEQKVIEQNPLLQKEQSEAKKDKEPQEQ